jgi:hypothetical protein
MNTEKPIFAAPKLCCFDMFVKLKPDQPKRFYNNSLTWCYRGDRFTNVNDEMLKKLLILFCKEYQIYDKAVLRDNSKPDNDPTKIILRLAENEIKESNLHLYPHITCKMYLPAWLLQPKSSYL